MERELIEEICIVSLKSIKLLYSFINDVHLI
jgi:hypothetical protein